MSNIDTPSRYTTTDANSLLSKQRSSFNAEDSVRYLWQGLDLPISSLEALNLYGDDLGLPSSFKVGHLAQASIALSALTAAQVYALRRGIAMPRVSVPRLHAAVEFKSERLYALAGQPPLSSWGPIGGLHKTSDGHVRVHDNFPHHRDGIRSLLGLSANADRGQVGVEIAKWCSVDFETAAAENHLVVAALRSYEQWDQTPQAKAISDFPISVRKIATGPAGLPAHITNAKVDKCLRGLRVVEMSRVIAAPLAGKTLAAHGADVLWVTSPNLPDLPSLDRDLGRGKRTIQIDINTEEGRSTLDKLLDEADVFIQGFRPGSLGLKGLSPADLARKKPNSIVCGNMSAYGRDGPWSGRRGFDSLVQTCSGMNVSEAEHYGVGEIARPTPCQALDHAGGYFLAAGITAALFKQATEGGSYQVDVSLAGVMKYLRSLGQMEVRTGFQTKDFESVEDVPELYLETRDSGFGKLTSIKHSASIEGVEVGWDIMPKPLGSDEPIWL